MAYSGHSGGAVWQADSDDEAETLEDFQSRNRDAVLCVIDVTPNMFRPCWGSNEETPFIAALKCCHALWRSKIVSQPKDLVGILLCGSEKDKNSSGFPNLYVIHELSTVTVNSILELDALKKSNDFTAFEQNIGSSSDYNLHEMLWLAKLLFDAAKTDSFGKKIIYFTCEDDPHSSGGTITQKDVAKKFRDIKNSGIDFEVVAFNEDFDISKFYSEILENPSALSVPRDIASLLNVTRAKQRRQRAIYHMVFEIAPEFKVGVGIYSIARRTGLPKAVKINNRNNEPVTKTVSKFRADTGVSVLKSEEVTMVEIKGEQAIFTKDELRSSKYSHEVGITLLAFMDHDKFDQFKWFRCDGYFLYPDDERWTGSKEFLGCLLRRCIILKKCVLVRLLLSRRSSPRLACLLPMNGDGEKVPQGFYMFMLPFADESRDNLSCFGATAEPSQHIVELMEKVVKKTTQKNFDLLVIQNPVLQMKWREIEAAVFNDEDIELEDDDFQDFTEPNANSMRQRIGDLSNEIMNNVKAGAGSSQSFHPSVSTLTKPKLDIKINSMEVEVRNKRVDKLTVETLKEFLRSVQVQTDPSKRRKADLVDLVYKYYAK